MNKTTLALIGVGGILGAVLVIGGLLFLSYSNKEIRLRNAIINKQTDNKNEMDAMWKKISQAAQVTDLQKKALTEIFNGYAQARTPEGGGALAQWVKEAVPSVDQTTFRNLQNIITGSRDGFVMRQKELIDLKREHDNILDTFPGSLILGSRSKINIVVVTSDRTEESFKSGKDNNINLLN